MSFSMLGGELTEMYSLFVGNTVVERKNLQTSYECFWLTMVQCGLA